MSGCLIGEVVINHSSVEETSILRAEPNLVLVGFLKAPVDQADANRNLSCAQIRLKKPHMQGGALMNSEGQKKQKQKGKSESKGQSQQDSVEGEREIVGGRFCYSCSVKEKVPTFLLSSHGE